MRNLSSCDRECGEACKFGEYFDIKNYACNDLVIHNLRLEY